MMAFQSGPPFFEKLGFQGLRLGYQTLRSLKEPIFFAIRYCNIL